ncbi:unnamed protein product [Leuciscus chuanchicus]
MVLLDATYRTTKYALPLFLVVVQTNVGYKPVAEFICENETTTAIAEALTILKQWNRWCRAFVPQGFSVAVTTNNGVEALNKSLKSFYLKFSGTGSLTSLLETMICDFIPEQLLSYRRLNFIYSSECKTYNPDVPTFLRDRPRSFVKHCLNSIQAASIYTKEHVEVLGKESFKVKSETTSAWFRVELGDSERYTSCECFLFKTTFLPCKHFFAVFSHSDKTWGDLSPVYCRSPYITLDFSVALTNPPITENSTQEDFSSDFCVSPLPYPRKQTHNSEPQSTGVGADQQRLREELKHLHDSCGVEVSVEETRKASTLINSDNLVNHSENLPRLTKDMASEVRHILKQDDPNMVISTAFKLCIRQSDLATLEEGSWLNDMVIDFKSQTIQCFDSMGQRHDEICHTLLNYLMEEHKIKKACCFEASRWTIGRMRTNCDIPVIRKVMVWEIVHQTIL